MKVDGIIRRIRFDIGYDMFYNIINCMSGSPVYKERMNRVVMDVYRKRYGCRDVVFRDVVDWLYYDNWLVGGEVDFEEVGFFEFVEYIGLANLTLPVNSLIAETNGLASLFKKTIYFG